MLKKDNDINKVDLK